MKQKTYTVFSVDENSPLLSIFLDEGLQEEYMCNMEEFTSTVIESGTDEDNLQLEQMDTSCDDCLVIKGF
jgi:hypothetical protein